MRNALLKVKGQFAGICLSFSTLGSKHLYPEPLPHQSQDLILYVKISKHIHLLSVQGFSHL